MRRLVGAVLLVGSLAGCGGTEADVAADVGEVQGAVVIPDCADYAGRACSTPRARQSCYNYYDGRPTPGLCICWTDGTWSCG